MSSLPSPSKSPVTGVSEAIQFIAPPQFGWTLEPGFFCPPTVYAVFVLEEYDTGSGSLVDGSKKDEVENIDEYTKDESIDSNEFDGIPSTVDVYPNPFRGATNITYTIGKTSKINVGVYDVNGNKVATLLNNATREPGQYMVTFQAESLAKGTYVVLLRTEDSVVQKRIILME